MPLFYKAVQSTFRSKDGKRKWFPRLVKVSKTTNTQRIGEMIAEISSVSPGDVHSVVRTLMFVVNREVMNGSSVCLDGMGSFTIIAHASGQGVDTPEEVSHTQIERLSMRFTPAYTRRADGTANTSPLLANPTYKRWK